MTLALGATFPLALAVAAGQARSTAVGARRRARVHRQHARRDRRRARRRVRADPHARPALDVPGGGDHRRARRRRLPGGRAARIGDADGRTEATPRERRTQRNADVAVARRVAVVAVAAICRSAAVGPRAARQRRLQVRAVSRRRGLDTVLRAGTLEYYKEGAAGTVSVRRLTGTTSLAIDGKVDASNAGDMLTQRCSACCRCCCTARRRTSASSVSAAASRSARRWLAGTVEHADVVEISPEVVEASHFFDRENGGALDAPGVRLIVGDGRSHLLLTPQRYDVIVSEPSNPWMAGVAALFTREFFEAARARLKPGRPALPVGAHLRHQRRRSAVDRADVRLGVSAGHDVAGRRRRSAADRRPTRTRSCRGSTAVAPGAAKGTASRRRWPTSESPKDTAPFALLSLFAGGPARAGALRRRRADPDRRPHGARVFGAARHLRPDDERQCRGDPGAGAATAAGAYARRSTRATDADWTSRGAMQLKAEAYRACLRRVSAGGRAEQPERRRAGRSVGRRGGRATRDEERQRAARRSPTGNRPTRRSASSCRASWPSGGDFEGALESASRGAAAGAGRPARRPSSWRRSSPTRATPTAWRRSPTRWPPAFPSGRIRGTTARPRCSCVDEHEDAVAGRAPGGRTAHPDHARAQNLLGAACATLGRRDCAQAAFEASIRANPRDPSSVRERRQLHAAVRRIPRRPRDYFAERAHASIRRRSRALAAVSRRRDRS